MPQSIYISGTYADLKTYRKAAALTVEDFGFRAKDSYTAGPAPVVESCLADVDGCDAFLGIVGLTYGWVPPDGDKRSITHREFDRAEGKKRLIFIVDAQADLAPEVKGFRDGFGGKVRAARFSSEDDFGASRVFWRAFEITLSSAFMGITRFISSAFTSPPRYLRQGPRRWRGAWLEWDGSRWRRARRPMWRLQRTLWFGWR
jgi:hypothetical protein